MICPNEECKAGMWLYEIYLQNNRNTVDVVMRHHVKFPDDDLATHIFYCPKCHKYYRSRITMEALELESCT